jgi:adenosylcobinamide amidohydrolase
MTAKIAIDNPASRTGGAALARTGEDSPMQVSQRDRWLIVGFDRIHAVASWAIVGGGLRRTRTVAWHQISECELRPPVDARTLLRRRLGQQQLPDDAVGLLTSRTLASYCDVSRCYGDVAARCIVTVGMGNALRVGDGPGPDARIGTINGLCRISVALSPEALLEALALAVEARTLAVREAELASTLSGEPASGTGTDCMVIAAPEHDHDRHPGAAYAGKHTIVGHLIGAAMLAATAQGIAIWRRDQENLR